MFYLQPEHPCWISAIHLKVSSQLERICSMSISHSIPYAFKSGSEYYRKKHITPSSVYMDKASRKFGSSPNYMTMGLRFANYPMTVTTYNYHLIVYDAIRLEMKKSFQSIQNRSSITECLFILFLGLFILCNYYIHSANFWRLPSNWFYFSNISSGFFFY